jgi:hypothetical protein
MSKKQNRVLSDATIEVILGRGDRDEHGEPPPEPLFYFKEAPDWDFLMSRLDADAAGPQVPEQEAGSRIQGVLAPEEFDRALYKAFEDLLDTGIPLSSRTTRELLKGLLGRLHSPDPQAEEHRRALMKAEVMGADLDVAIALKRRQGVRRPVKEAKDEVAKHWGHNSGEALRKALQPSRVNRRRKGDAAKSQNQAAAVQAGTGMKDEGSVV